MKIDFGVKALGLVIVLAILGLAGCFLYNRHQINQEMIRVQDDVAQLTRELDGEQTRLTGEIDKQNKAQNRLAEIPKKKAELRAAQNDLGNELKRLQLDQAARTPGSAKPGSPDEVQKEIAGLNGSIAADEEDVKKLDCHYNCMGNDKAKDFKNDSGKGEWNRFTHPPVWTCKTHHYSFTDNIQSMDYQYETYKRTNRIRESQKKIAVLVENLEKIRLEQKEKEKTAAAIIEIKAKITQTDNEQKNMESEVISLNETIQETEKSIAGGEKKVADLKSRIKSLNGRLLEVKGGK